MIGEGEGVGKSGDEIGAKSMVVAGVMSGTSADGVDVAVCRISRRGEGGVPRVKVLGHLGFGYSKAVRGAVLRVMEGEAVTAAEMSRLHWRLGEVYADCVEKACEEFGVETAIVEIRESDPPFDRLRASSLR